MKSKLVLPYPRPKSLSDPSQDHTPEVLSRLLATPDDQLQWNDFQTLLGPNLPAGTYNESAYFLPIAFDYIRKNDENSLDLVDALVGFISKNAQRLADDDALESARGEMQACFDHWIGRFNVDHFDRDACRARQWVHDHFDIVRQSETVFEAAGELVHFKTHTDLAIAFFQGIATAPSDPVKSAWFLESARARVSGDVRRPPNLSPIRELFADMTLIKRHASIVRQSTVFATSGPTYWRDLFELLWVDVDQ